MYKPLKKKKNPLLNIDKEEEKSSILWLFYPVIWVPKSLWALLRILCRCLDLVFWLLLPIQQLFKHFEDIPEVPFGPIRLAAWERGTDLSLTSQPVTVISERRTHRGGKMHSWAEFPSPDKYFIHAPEPRLGRFRSNKSLIIRQMVLFLLNSFFSTKK